MAIVAGKALRLWIGGTPAAVGSATNCTFSISVSTITTRHKDSTGNFVEKEPDEISGTLSTEAFINEENTTFGTLGAAVLVGTEVDWRFSSAVSTSHKWSGKGYITSFEENAPVDGKATYSVTIETTAAIAKGTV